MLSLKLIKEYIVNSQPSSIMKFRSLQDKEVWLQNAVKVFNDAKIEDLNKMVDEVEFNDKQMSNDKMLNSTRFVIELYSKKLSQLVADVNVRDLSLNEIYNELTMRISPYRTNEKATMVINNIIGSSICNFLRLYNDEQIIEFVKNDNEYTTILKNYIAGVYDQYVKSKGISSYGLSEYVMIQCLKQN